jgi:hypothetical protein
MIPRITLDDLYPRSLYDDEPVEGIFKTVEGLCWVCGRPTKWVSLHFEAHVCSMVCDGLGWHRYWKASAAP